MRTWVVFISAIVVIAGLGSGAGAAEKREESMMTGTVIVLDSAAMTLTVKQEIQGGGDEEASFVLAPDAVVRVHGMKGKLSQLKKGDIVTVTYKVKEGQNLATAVHHM